MGPVSAGWPIIVGIVVLGVGLIWRLREGDREVHTSPLLVLHNPAPGRGALASQYANTTAAVRATTARLNVRYPDE